MLTIKNSIQQIKSNLNDVSSSDHCHFCKYLQLHLYIIYLKKVHFWATIKVNLVYHVIEFVLIIF